MVKIACVWTGWFSAQLHPEGELTFFSLRLSAKLKESSHLPVAFTSLLVAAFRYRCLFPVPLFPQRWMSWNSESFKSVPWSEQTQNVSLLLCLINLGHSGLSLQASVFLSPMDTVKSCSEPCCYDLIFLQTERFNLFRCQAKRTQTWNSPGYSNLAARELKGKKINRGIILLSLDCNLNIKT